MRPHRFMPHPLSSLSAEAPTASLSSRKAPATLLLKGIHVGAFDFFLLDLLENCSKHKWYFP